MTTMIRKQIYLEAEQDALLKRLAGQIGQSESELIRQAIDQQLAVIRQPRLDRNVWAAERAFIQQLIDRRGTPTDRCWTRDDLYDR